MYAVEFGCCIRWSVFSFVIGIRISPALMLISSSPVIFCKDIIHWPFHFFTYSNALTSASVWFWDFALALFNIHGQGVSGEICHIYLRYMTGNNLRNNQIGFKYFLRFMYVRYVLVCSVSLYVRYFQKTFQLKNYRLFTLKLHTHILCY